MAGVLSNSTQPAPARVIVTTAAAVVAVALQPLNDGPRTIAGVAGSPKFGLNFTLIVLPAASAPTGLVVNPTVHDVITAGFWEPPAKETSVTAVVAGAAMTTAAGDAGASLDVETLKVAAR